MRAHRAGREAKRPRDRARHPPAKGSRTRPRSRGAGGGRGGRGKRPRIRAGGARAPSPRIAGTAARAAGGAGELPMPAGTAAGIKKARADRGRGGRERAPAHGRRPAAGRSAFRPAAGKRAPDRRRAGAAAPRVRRRRRAGRDRAGRAGRAGRARAAPGGGERPRADQGDPDGGRREPADRDDRGAPFHDMPQRTARARPRRRCGCGGTEGRAARKRVPPCVPVVLMAGFASGPPGRARTGGAAASGTLSTPDAFKPAPAAASGAPAPPSLNGGVFFPRPIPQLNGGSGRPNRLGASPAKLGIEGGRAAE